METLTHLRRQTPAMLDALEAVVASESPSADLEANARCADLLGELGAGVLGEPPERLTVDGRPHLRWRFATPRVLLLGHFDTVWPVGTYARWPFKVEGDRATGPGTFDMKAGIVQAFFGLATLEDLAGVEVLLTSDEEVGSQTSRELVEDTARTVDATLVLEPAGPDGALKVARKGASWYTLRVTGTAAHAGLEPEKGVNAIIELAHQVLACERLADPEAGTSVTPTVALAGSTSNVVPASASVEIDVRAATGAEQQRVHDAMRLLRPRHPDAHLTISGGPNRPPLPESAARALYEQAVAIAAQLGLPPPPAGVAGGASDGNFTAGVGTPTLDGLGAVGDGAHAEGEHVVVSAMAERAALLAALTDHLRGGGPRP